MDQPIADALAASYAQFEVDGGPVEGIMTPILDPAQEREEIRCPAATVAYKSPSGSLYPQKLVLHLLTLCIEKRGLNLQTHAPVQRVVARHTPKVYTGKEIFRQTYGPAYIDYHLHDLQAYRDNKLQALALMADYLIQRPDGMVIFGGQRGSAPGERLLLGNTDDTHADPERTVALREALPRHFEGWPKEDLGEGEGLVHAWTGLMGYHPHSPGNCRRNRGPSLRGWHGPDNDLRQRADGADAGGGSV
ncbi:hypothetical protein MSAN_02367600 [Mycena sanguinolenta]|uniref:Uncharacterized protein n=1 Tax=Mycena sanguinolenta TaxID=230812 RepID=A0A8H7CEZ7_9AGAR|nr:hypothetical protein MSAN_02367600 [Mycena sanguinolenta]